MIRVKEREEKTNPASRTWSLSVGGQAERSTRLIRSLDRVVRCSRLNCQLVPSIHRTIRIQDTRRSLE